MNIFVIPSMYPSPDYPVSGIFIKEQAISLAHHYSNIQLGISLWGQRDESLLLWTKKPLLNIRKILQKKESFKVVTLFPNLTEYHSPTFTWTQKFLKGNLNGIYQACLQNLIKFEEEYGKVDLIHAHVVYPAGVIAMQLKQKFGFSFLLTEHISPSGTTLTSKLIRQNSEFGKVYQSAAKVVAVSSSLANELKSVTSKIVDIIPNSIDESYFTLIKKLQTDKFIFFTLAYIHPDKGISELLKSISVLKENKPEVQFRIGGEGEQAEEFKKLSKKLGVDHLVTWLGPLTREQARDEFQNCDAFVLPSRHESMGVVYAEAIACGKPIIATRCGGPESIVNKENGLLVDVGDVDGLARAMQYIMEHYHDYDPGMIRQDFLDRFSSKVVAAKIVDLYKEVIATNQHHK